jgi:hypothetical protein
MLKKSQINTDTLMLWAGRKLGPSKCKRIFIVDRQNADYGWYDWNGNIYINIRNAGSMPSIYRTLAHEWTHAQQTYNQYTKLHKRYGYDNNPYEIAARNREKTCFNRVNC